MRITKDQALSAGHVIGVDFNKIQVEQLQRGIQVELREHHKALNGSIRRAAQIAYDHLKENPRYYKV